ncbi:GntP family permease [Vineibacter terrae]|uniref:GntP family permease n=1 Tax=Vineibacter terrae TaxID=2586908 RepID=UPI002E32BD03|nr:GntP family permease [Vineibacter terrae]HEX2886531.1 GntP family permease [Vineibacter terrae]
MFTVLWVGLCVAALVALTGRLKLHPLIALAGVVVVFGIAADMTANSVGRAFGIGFVNTLEQVGLVLVGGAVAASFVAGSGAAARVGTALGGRGIALPLGLVAGIGASPTAALALAQPVLSAAGPRAAVPLSLALLASHALVPPSPIAIAGAAVLRADAMAVAVIGAPLAVIVAVVGWLAVRRTMPAEPDAPSETLGRATLRDGLVLALPVLVPLALLVVQSVAQIPSEPLGRGGAREFYTGVSRPLMLMVVAVGLVLLLTWRWDEKALSERGWMGEALRGIAATVLVVGTAGGFGRVIDETGIPTLLAEDVSGLRLGVLGPFVVALVIKTLMGSSLVATLSAAGMVEPMLPSLGLAGDGGRVLAVLAIGAGAMAVSHINDAHFWLTAHVARLTPGRTLRVFSLATAIQAVLAVAILLLLSLVLR